MDYIEKKAVEGAQAVAASVRGVDPRLCYLFNRRLLEEARNSILKLVGKMGREGWQRLSFSDRAAICTMVVRALLDEKRVCQFLSGEKRGLL